jgi:hypothetical protein
MQETSKCPSCNSSHTTPIKFSMTYGLIGSLLLKLARCNECKSVFDRRSGSTRVPAIYRVISTVVILFFVTGIVTFALLITQGYFDQQIKTLTH